MVLSSLCVATGADSSFWDKRDNPVATFEIEETDLPAKCEERIEVEIELSEEMRVADPDARKRRGDRINTLFESPSGLLAERQ